MLSVAICMSLMYYCYRTFYSKSKIDSLYLLRATWHVFLVKFKPYEYNIYHMTKENQQKEVLCPYCESKFRDRIELSKHIDGVHTGLGLLEGNTKGW